MDGGLDSFCVYHRWCCFFSEKGLLGGLGALLQARGYNVRLRKLDPYLNVDPGTMSPLSMVKFLSLTMVQKRIWTLVIMNDLRAFIPVRLTMSPPVGFILMFWPKNGGATI